MGAIRGNKGGGVRIGEKGRQQRSDNVIYHFDVKNGNEI